MDMNENVYEQSPVKKSPFADSPYESAYIVPAPQEQPPVQPVALPEKPKKKKRGVRPVLVILLVIAFCVATAVVVDLCWQNRLDRMEQAVEERFAALKTIYNERHEQNQSAQLPSEGPMTPGQVYAQNVQAVVAVNARYQSNGGYSESSGSGFLISADGYVVTNYHVIEDATAVAVALHNEEVLEAEIVGYESSNDIALLKVEGENLPFVKLGSSDLLQVGDQVAAIGNPLGELTASLTVGYVSAKDRIVDTDGSVINMLQTDAAINAGNSGGPLFNMNGEVIGVITAKYSGNSGSGASIEGLGFAIPTDDIVGILSDLKEFGYVTGAYLGVVVRDVDTSAQSYGLPAGAYVQEVTKGFAAERCGIRAGDIIVNLGGYEVDSVTTLTRVLRRLEAGQTVTVTVYRSGRQEYLEITLDEKPVQTEDTPTQNENNNGDQDNNQNGSFGYNPFDDFFDFFFGG